MEGTLVHFNRAGTWSCSLYVLGDDAAIGSVRMRTEAGQGVTFTVRSYLNTSSKPVYLAEFVLHLDAPAKYAVQYQPGATSATTEAVKVHWFRGFWLGP
jgi:hypothetical protein